MYTVKYCLDLRKPNLRKNLDLRKIAATTDFLVHKLFDLGKGSCLRNDSMGKYAE